MSQDFYVMVLYKVHEICWVICEVCVSWYDMFLWMYIFELIKVVWMFAFVTFRWCFSVDGWMGHYSCIAPSITWVLLWVKGFKVKGREFYENDNCGLNVICAFMWFYGYYTCLYEVCELYYVYCSNVLWSFTKKHYAWFLTKCPR